ncbi:unnamed protein product [Auanema sp. JU1783]|nr:unnamed protein product [Auanema sp. JU1783]
MVVTTIAELANVREDALRLLLSVLAGYPLAFIHRSFFCNKSPTTQHTFFVVAGVLLYLFNCGFAIVHSLISIVLAYVITNYFAGTQISIIAAHTCFLGHLLLGYAYAETDQYDITWTTPFCIMTLRFIGLVMDVHDGVHYEKSKADQKLTAIREVPGLLEIAAFGLFFTGTLVGPQFTLARFRSFVNGEHLDENRKPKDSAIMVSLGRFLFGVFYMVIHQWGAVWIPSDYFNTQAFFDLPFFWRWTWVTLWFRLTMYRYCAMWLITEGAAILTGIGYNGKDEKGNDRWDGVRDLHITTWETGHDFNSIVLSFNCGTNTFAKNHLFRRLRWLNSKPLAHVATLMYLAIWHGYHLGYFLLFLFEFACMVAQEQLYALIKRTPGWPELIAQPWARPFIWIFGKLSISYSMGFVFLCFGLIKTKYWWAPIKSLYFVGFFFYFLVWPILFQVLLRVLPKHKKAEGEKAEKKKEL